ncbi:hypothetical protein D3C84_636950 [compost metagenome]
MDFGEQGRQIALVGGPALGQRQIPGGQGLRQQLGLLDEGVGDEIGEAEQGQQGLTNRIGQGVIVGRQLDQPLPLAPGLILQQGGQSGEGCRRWGKRRGMLGHGCRPCD